ncbi:traB domain-containing protein-like [Paramacrobiotus metropolitanus]|uniref:traB domain-containing protein-like n=1 Tax=Paramacrobiotus metropolitanus TaxID=2943436 RepID=UPI0024462A51|nr:traB domain-containing protein-like [Paramacrobiotus metropolitanus]
MEDGSTSGDVPPGPWGLSIQYDDAVDLPAPTVRPVNPVLPDTVTMLEHAPSGGRVYIVGTVHLGEKSQEDVAATIRTVKPDSVMLELCTERLDILTVDEDEARRALSPLSELNRKHFHILAQQLGVAQAFRVFWALKQSGQHAKNLGISGSDMRTAFREAANLPNCTVLLGDRPQSITHQRTYGALTLWEYIRHLWIAVRDLCVHWNISQDDVEKLKTSAFLEADAARMSAACPTVQRAIVHERDVVMAEGLKWFLAQPVMTTEGPRSRVMVGVVGMAHVAGIQRAWNRPSLSQNEQKNLFTIPPTAKWRERAPVVVKVSWLLLCGYITSRGGRFLANLVR